MHDAKIEAQVPNEDVAVAYGRAPSVIHYNAFDKHFDSARTFVSEN